jgi:hypothetical protein
MKTFIVSHPCQGLGATPDQIRGLSAMDLWFNDLDCRGRRRSDRRADRANLRRRKVLAGLEGDRRPFRQVVEPHAAHVSASKRVALAVLAEKRADSSVFPKLRDGAAHSWCPTSLQTLLLLSRESTEDYPDKTVAYLGYPCGQSTSVERLGTIVSRVYPPSHHDQERPTSCARNAVSSRQVPGTGTTARAVGIALQAQLDHLTALLPGRS